MVRLTLPATQPLNQQEWRDISTIISKRWPYWFATPPSSRESAVAILASHLYSDFNGINPDSGYHVDDQNIEFWLTVTDRKASQLILNVAINALFNLQTKDNLEQQLAKVERSIQLLHHKVAPRHPDYQARILILAAIDQGINWQPDPNLSRWWHFSRGDEAKQFFETLPNSDPVFGLEQTNDKVVTAKTLRMIGLPAPKNDTISSLHEVQQKVTHYPWPVVLKPSDRGKGKGVTTDIKNQNQLAAAFTAARQYSQKLLLEEQLAGDDYRLLVVRGKLVAATLRTPPAVIGDGLSNITTLIMKLNRERQLDAVKRRYLKLIDPTDTAIVTYLKQTQLTLHSVPARGERVQLRGNANISTGGEPLDVLHRVHDHVAKLAIQTTTQFGLTIAGVDYMTTDLTMCWRESGGAILEVNATPGLDLHIASGMDEVGLGKTILGFE
ncbi:hypothetical protein OAM26_03630 [Porticoccaceae bacterium]|nr:hypothetical protein [Porticoccaceae bacterium]